MERSSAEQLSLLDVVYRLSDAYLKVALNSSKVDTRLSQYC